MLRTLVAEHNDTIRLGIRSVLNRCDRPIVLDEVSDKNGLISHLQARQYEIVIVEPMLSDGTAETLIKQVCQTAPQTNILIFTALDEMTFGTRAIRSGAKGYLMKTCSTRELVTAVERVGGGKTHISSALAEKLAINLYKTEGTVAHEFLSNRERQTFSMLVCGKTISQIAETLQLSVKTVSTHKAKTMVKLQAASLSELINYAISQGLLDDCQAHCASLSSRDKTDTTQF
jgi:DNA-binding NarL/FixJ family response regulator